MILSPLPRAGLDVILSKSLNHVKWFGLSPGESYPDKKASQRVGVWEVGNVSEFRTAYDVPQENGNRMNNRWLKITSENAGLKLIVRRVNTPTLLNPANGNMAE